MKWYLGSLNDGLFIIDKPPRPSTDDACHEAHTPKLVLNVVALSQERAQAIVDAHNTVADEVERLLGLVRNVIAGNWCLTDLQEAIGDI